MTYWLPPKLALPKNTKTLLFHDDCVDRGAAWAIHSSLTLHKEGDAYTLDTQAWNMLCYVRWQSYQKPDWTRRLANPTRSSTKTRRFGAYSLSTQDESGFLPTWEASDRYVILGLPF